MVKGKTPPPDSISLPLCDLLGPVGPGSVPFNRDFLPFSVAAPTSRITSGSGLGRCHIGNQFKKSGIASSCSGVGIGQCFFASAPGEAMSEVRKIPYF